ncbi:hypothetical protein MAHJHV57_51710 [Mycobacterium avium subsp. hominissuis]
MQPVVHAADLGSRTAWLREPYADAPDRTGTCYLDPDAVEAHLLACTEAEITASVQASRCASTASGSR